MVSLCARVSSQSMMEVGRMPSAAQDRSHFAMWCIVSSPLILGHDLLDHAVNDRIWPIITHPVALSISQSYAGHPGGLEVLAP